MWWTDLGNILRLLLGCEIIIWNAVAISAITSQSYSSILKYTLLEYVTKIKGHMYHIMLQVLLVLLDITVVFYFTFLCQELVNYVNSL